MKCRELEDAMSANFSAVPKADFARLLKRAAWEGRWDELCARYPQAQPFAGHLADCGDCVDSLLRYLDLRDKLDYHDYPCFHLAAAASDPEVCLDGDEKELSIRIAGGEAVGVVIGFCPWCGVEIPEGMSPWQNRKPVVEVTPYGREWVRCPGCETNFSLKDPHSWDGWRHQTCGQRLRLKISK